MNAARSLHQPGRALEIVRCAFERGGAPIRPRGDHAFMASCPLHPDANPSLSVTWRACTRTSSAGGMVLLHCFSCNGHPTDITAALGLRLADLFDNPQPRNPDQERPTAPPRHIPRPTAPTASPVEHQWTRVRVYTYTNRAGLPVQQVIREECTCGGSTHKRFLQRYRVGRRWQYRKPQDFTPVLYRLRDLYSKRAAGRWTFLVEGEKDADTAARCGQIATTNAQGAASFPAALLTELAGRSVAIVADRDAAGYQRALTLFGQLRGQAAQLAILLPAPLSPKSDLTDHVDAGHWDSRDRFGGLLPISPAAVADLLRQSTSPAAQSDSSAPPTQETKP